MALNQRRQNNTFAGARLHYGTREADLEAYDSLPGEVRRLLDENNTKLSSESVVAYGMSLLRQGAPDEEVTDWVIRKVQKLEVAEIDVFSGRHLASYGYALPHVTAKVSIQRYGAAGPARRRHRLRIRGFGLLDVPEAA